MNYKGTRIGGQYGGDFYGNSITFIVRSLNPSRFAQLIGAKSIFNHQIQDTLCFAEVFVGICPILARLYVVMKGLHNNEESLSQSIFAPLMAANNFPL